MKQLFSFRKTYLNHGETKKLFLSATAETLKLVNGQVSLHEVWLSVDIIIPCVFTYRVQRNSIQEHMRAI